MFCSTIIPTVGRDTLARAVESVLSQNQSAAQFELIIVNDSGVSLPQADWQQSERVQIVNTHRRERSIARNTGASIARGKYLHFLDDDDWMAQDAFQHFWELSKASYAVWLYGVTQLVDRQTRPLIRLQHGLQGNCFIQVMAGEWIPLQSSLINAETFFKVGGFNPLITGPEDIDLLRRIALVGDLAETQAVVAYLSRGVLGSTTDYEKSPVASRWARENILDSPHVFQKMRTSAHNPYWKGRILRVFLTSFIWNTRRYRIFAAASRAVYGLLCVLSGGMNLLAFDYWRAVLRPYASETFELGFQNAQPASSIETTLSK